MIALIICVCALLASFIYVKAKQNPPSFPKGPKGVPILGNLLQLGTQQHKTFLQFGKKFSDIFSLKLGRTRVVVLNNYQDIIDALAFPEFSGRPDQRDRSGGKPRGIIFNVGTSFTEQRRFALKTLRDLGLGRKCMEEKLLFEVESLLEKIRLEAGKPVQIMDLFNVASLNALWILVTDTRFPHNDKRLNNLIGVLHSSRKKSKVASALRYFPRLAKLYKKVKGMFTTSKTGNEEILSFVNEAIKYHQKTIEMHDNPRDFIDAYIMEIERTTDHTSSFFKEEGMKNLVITLLDLFTAGAETTATALSWTMLLLAKYPEKQKKLQSEICNVIGKTRLPVLEDRKNMPYTHSVILEVLRFSALAPLAVAHCATKDITFRNYCIPQGTLIIPNLYSALHDPKVWTDADVFRPERFLSSDGTSLRKYDAFLPFSTGKRICPGASFALDELFLFTAGLFQRFEVVPNLNGGPINLDSHSSGVLLPVPQTLIFNEIVN